jgi:hypothetical protein
MARDLSLQIFVLQSQTGRLQVHSISQKRVFLIEANIENELEIPI